jgi:hypothetical protein
MPSRSFKIDWLGYFSVGCQVLVGRIATREISVFSFAGTIWVIFAN